MREGRGRRSRAGGVFQQPAREILQNLAPPLIDHAASRGILTGMKQSSLDLNLSTKKTRKQELLAQMDRVVPWAALVELIAPYYPEGKNGRPAACTTAWYSTSCVNPLIAICPSKTRWTFPALLALGQTLIEQETLPAMLAEALGSGARLLAPLRSLPLPSAMACKLTVMRDQRPTLFQHSLVMTTVAVFLALKSGLSERDCSTVAAAALLHDLGVLHMDPVWNDPDHKVVGVGRKHLVAHPISAMLMIRDTQAYPRAAEVAVLEHHERMDGSGYPRALLGADITPMGRILLLAEVVAAFYEKYDDMPAQRLSLVLRLNHRKFPSALVAFILPLLQEEVARESALMPLGNDAPRQIELLAEAFAY